MTLGEKIQDLRRKHSMSQDTLAEKLDVSRQAVSKWERDEAMPETDKIIRIAQVFGVSTDYLLLQQPSGQSQQPPHTPTSGSHRSTAARLEQFIRRHGYKVGYAFIVGGIIACVIALLVMWLFAGFGSGMFDIFNDFGSDIGNSFGGGIWYGSEDLPQEVLDQLYGQSGSGWVGNDMLDMYNNAVDQMEQAWQSTTQTMALIFGIPVLVCGIASIILGIVIVRKGKQIAAQVP